MKLTVIKRLLTHPRYNRVLFWRTLGNFLFLFSIFIILKTLYSPTLEEGRYLFDQIMGNKYVVAENSAKVEGNGLANLISQQRIKPLIPVDTDFSIVVPKIAANAAVVGSVDPSNDQDYLPALQKGVAHAAGTALPGEGGLVYMFAHSTDYFYNVSSYNAVFYLLYKLEPGDEVNVFYKGIRYKYLVYDRKVVRPDEVQYLTGKTNHEELRLQTCWPLGTTLERLIVFARPAAEISSR